MKVLEKGRRSLNWMGIQFADDEPVSQKLKLAQKIFSVSFAMTYIAICSLFVITFLNVQLINPEEFFFILLQLVMTAHGSTAFITIYSCNSRISNVFQSLTEIYEKYPNERLSALNAKFEWGYEQFYKAKDKWIIVGTTFPSAITILLSYFLHGEFDVAYLFHPFKVRLPWDQTTMLGYVGELLLCILNMEVFWAVGVQIFFLFVFLCQTNFVFTAMFVSFMEEFDRTHGMRKKLSLIHKLINFNIDIKMLFYKTRRMYSFGIASMFFWTVIGLAACLFIFEMKMKNFDIDTISIIIVAITNVLWLYLHCALGKFVTERYDELPDSLFDSKWYKLPNRLQKYFILLLSYTQEPLFFDGFGIYALNMGTFTTTLRRVYSYYMMFRSIEFK